MSTSEDTPVAITLGEGATVVTQPAHGSLSALVDGAVTFTPTPNYNGGDGFRYAIGGSEADVTISISAAADAPTARDDAVTVAEGASIAGNVGGNDTDVDGGATCTVVTTTAHGTLTLGADCAFSYTHDGSAIPTSDSFSYSFGAAQATVTLTITPVNDAPVLQDDEVTVAEGGVATGNLFDNDSDEEGDAIVLDDYTQPAHGSLVVNADGTFGYTHNGDEANNDAFTYTVGDATAAVHITITPVNDAPIAVADALTVDEAASALGNVLSNDSDAEGTTLSAALVTSPSHGTVYFNGDGSYQYQHDGTEGPTDAFTYTASDGNLTSATTTVQITVMPVNDPPIPANYDVTLTEGGVCNKVGTTLCSDPGGQSSILANVFDADGGALTASGPINGPLHGSAFILGNGLWAYYNNGDEVGSDSFQYMVSDGNGGTAIGTVHVTVNLINDVPYCELTSNPVSTSRDTSAVVPFGLNLADGDNSPVTVNCDYSLNAGGTWTAATLVQGTSLTPQPDLALQALLPLGLGNTANVRFRCRGNDGTSTGAYCASLPITVFNRSVIYVNGGLSTGSDNGTSWANAFRGPNALTRALNESLSNSYTGTRELWVTGGTYLPTGTTGATGRASTFTVNGNVALYGGFAGGETRKELRDPEVNPTLLSGDIGVSGSSGDNSFHVVTLQNGALIDGFTISNGRADNAGTNAVGAAIYSSFGSGSVSARNILAQGNYAGDGGILLLRAPSGAQTINLNNIEVRNNRTGYNGIVQIDGAGTKTINAGNLIIAGNTSTAGYLLAVGGVSGSIDHATIADNFLYGVGIYGCGNDGLTVRNSIWRNNLNGGSPVFPYAHCTNAPLMTFRANDIQGSGGSTAWFGQGTDAGGNIDINPLFVGAPDYHLTGGSPAINAGVAGALDPLDADRDSITTDPLPYDLDGAKRNSGGAPDMGAFETSN